jgi:hypothetical protein
VIFATINLSVASQRVFIVISLSNQSENVWIHPRRSLVVMKFKILRVAIVLVLLISAQ